MIGAARTVALVGLEAVGVRVEAAVGRGLPGFTILGVKGSVAAQAADRVRAALSACGVSVSQRRLIVNLAPADVPKRGARFDLAIAVAVLRAIGLMPPGDETVLAELALNGTTRPVRGVLPSLRPGEGPAIVALEDEAEAELVRPGQVLGVGDLITLLDHLAFDGAPEGAVAPSCWPAPERDIGSFPEADPVLDLALVRGQHEARRALEIAAAGGHHLLLLGPPGVGKTMLARCLVGLLPRLDEAEALTLAAVRSVLGRPLLRDGAVDRRPPFAAPHHSASGAALLGGGSGVARPGAVSAATHGVLFLDEVMEWSPRTLDGLREPLQEGVVRIARADAAVTFPAKVLLVAAGNPCPCGPARDGCRCKPQTVARYRARLTGPLADRFDLAPHVEHVPPQLLAGRAAGEPTEQVLPRVRAARDRARERFGMANGAAPAEALRRHATSEALAALTHAAELGQLSARGFDKALRVAMTCADLAGNTAVTVADANEAIAHRLRLESLWAAA